MGFMHLCEEALQNMEQGRSVFNLEAVRQYARGSTQPKDFAGYILKVANGQVQQMSVTVVRLAKDAHTGKVNPLHITETYRGTADPIPSGPAAYYTLKEVLDRVEKARHMRPKKIKKPFTRRSVHRKGRRPRGK
ncbi:hypothetical protein [Chitinophaga tropicalis]|uniref:Uncharacterized protein n=1 Tax=Chitinophaga tropicalis TaxID=2683588 RepID=A0A7K1U000_9BACT|nr:hypothetical protein [Chitinophaga tropicalis]MVT07688.1 hypothetical protein [Chitinophaga tropicalis]